MDPAGRTRTRTDLGGGEALDHGALDRPYLAVFEQASQRIVTLPAEGEIVIGRGTDAGVVLADVRVSREHAKIEVGGDAVVLTDLGSQNGTRVGGAPVESTRRLASGDVIEIGGAAIVFHGPSRSTAGTSELDPDTFRARVDAEVQRATLTGRSFGVLAIVAEPASLDQLGFSERCTRLDVWSRFEAGVALLLLPERTPEEIEVWADELAKAVPSARIGVAVHPDDAADSDALIGGARAAAAWTEAEPIAWASESARVIDIDDETQIVLADPAMLRVYELLERLAASDLPVLIHGETGTGKELAALALHRFSPRREQRLVVLNCAALTETLVESELFGHVKGAFTGAASSKTGLLEIAHGGSILLDEIGELPLATQAKLLRALGTKRITRIGDVTERAIDVRVIAATNRSLEDDVHTGRFRSDLFYRLSGAIVWLPPLAHRPRELALLARRFLGAERTRLGRPSMQLSPAALERLAHHRFPGNVRELKNVMEFCAAAFDVAVIEPEHLAERLATEDAKRAAASDPPAGPHEDGTRTFLSLEAEVRALERQRISDALAATDGNRKRAAELLGVPLRTFSTKLNQYGLRHRSRKTGEPREES